MGWGMGYLSIKEKRDRVFPSAIDSTPISLFPKPRVLNNIYYLIGFLGNWAQIYANRLADGSTRQFCMVFFFAKNKFHVCNKGSESSVKALIQDESIPTDMVHEKYRRKGLQYAGGHCLKLCVAVKHVFVTIATADNFIACDGSVLSGIVLALKFDTKVDSNFAELCNMSSASKYSHSCAALCFQFCLLLYGCVRKY